LWPGGRQVATGPQQIYVATRASIRAPASVSNRKPCSAELHANFYIEVNVVVYWHLDCHCGFTEAGGDWRRRMRRIPGWSRNRALLQTGRCAQIIDRGDVGPLWIDSGGEKRRNPSVHFGDIAASKTIDHPRGSLWCTPKPASSVLRQSLEGGFGCRGATKAEQSSGRVSSRTVIWLLMVSACLPRLAG